jgi:hypothetical protein
VAAVKSDTGTILTDVNTGAGAIYNRLGAPAGASMSADIAAVNAKTTNLPAAPASTTNITAGIITTTTNLTNLPAVPVDWLSAAGVKADAVTKIQAGLSTYAGGAVASVTGNVGGSVASVTAAVSITGDLSATMKTSVESAVWDASMAAHLTGGSTGASLNGAGSAGNPWTSPLPGAYGAGTAGYLIGNYIDATISGRAAKTDLPANFGNVIILPSGEVAANVLRVTGRSIRGSGTQNDPWGP